MARVLILLQVKVRASLAVFIEIYFLVAVFHFFILLSNSTKGSLQVSRKQIFSTLVHQATGNTILEFLRLQNTDPLFYTPRTISAFQNLLCLPLHPFPFVELLFVLQRLADGQVDTRSSFQMVII